MIWILLALPAICGVLVFLPLIGRLTRTILVGAAAAHLSLVLLIWIARMVDVTPLLATTGLPTGALSIPMEAAGGWLGIDHLSLLVLTISSLLFMGASLYSLGYLGPERKQRIKALTDELHVNNQPDAMFAACLLMFLSATTVVATARHLGILWVAVEATTLATTPLIYFHRNRHSLEAAWKYLLLCSVGIAMALLGNFFLAVATAQGSGGELELLLPELQRHAGSMSPNWLRAAFLLMLVGYGTKMGLAPMHAWLPDAHSEAPSPVSALLSGALLNCAFLAILRMLGVLDAAEMGDFGRKMLVGFGLLSMLWAAAMLIFQTDFKRMLAYSSVEHMGILALGAGIGGIAATGSMFHALNHSLTKAALFLVAGNILARYKTKNIPDVRGLLSTMRGDAVLWIAGILAITGAPPFGLFTSELMILRGIVSDGHWIIAVAFLLALAIAFASMLWTLTRMTWGKVPEGIQLQDSSIRSMFSASVPAVFLAGVLALGIWTADPVWRVVQATAAVIGGNGGAQ